ncbi:M23 family metallopeptidase [Nitriliruptor alkaliphilus]|uniref:M23 family metallopeptidase n=1 Tax=Nitriliruptor alkaliphilus TaxID=427918 RepID=UPI0006963998|nr:M23 family metallopeptidase [Nitriliruptor alkaliphilus]
MSRLSLALVVLVLTGLVGPPPTPAAAVPAYEAPVPGAVLRPFIEPAHPYGPGHRGVDLVARRGDPVHAAAGGEVTFAGSVAGSRWVSVRHGDGIVTSYGALDAVHVRAGDVVTRGEAIGTATGSHGDDVLRPEPGLHWSARRGETYIDPLGLLDAPLPRPTLVGPGGWAGTHPTVEPFEPYPGGARLFIMATPSRVAERPGYARPPNHHHLLQVPGYGTEGPHPVLDPDKLGYGPDDTSVFSYRGCDPTPDGCDPRPYGGQDTDLSIDEAAALLEAQLRALQAAQPHRPVDLLGHSMGGDVITHYLTYHHDPTDLGLPPVVNLISAGTPHGGSGTASLLRGIGDNPISGNILELGRLGADAFGLEGAGRVSLGSQPLERYGVPVWGDRPARDPDRLAELGIRVLEIAGSRDLVVGRIDAGSVGDALVLPGGHSSVLETEAMYETVYRFLDDQPLPAHDRRVGWGSDAASDATRTLATLLELDPVRGVTKALAKGDGRRVVWEIAKEVAPGPSSGTGGPPDTAEHPMAPDAALTPVS